MIVLWLATSVICQQDQPPVDPIVYGGPHNNGWVWPNERRKVVPEPYTVEPEVKQEPQKPVDIRPLVEYHERKAIENAIKSRANPLSVAIQKEVEPPNIDWLLIEMERQFQLQQQVLFLEKEYADAAEAAFAWMMQET